MSIMDQMESLDGAQAPEVVPENEEYKIRIICDCRHEQEW